MARGPMFDAGVDGATARLIAAARATKATEGLPAASARRLVAQAQGVRYYLEADQRELARFALDDLVKLVESSDDGLLVKAYTGLADKICRLLGWEVTATRPAR